MKSKIEELDLKNGINKDRIIDKLLGKTHHRGC